MTFQDSGKLYSVIAAFPGYLHLSSSIHPSSVMRPTTLCDEIIDKWMNEQRISYIVDNTYKEIFKLLPLIYWFPYFLHYII